MRYGIRLSIVGLCAALLLAFAIGCAKREHRKVRVMEEQREGEVVEEKPGEMVPD